MQTAEANFYAKLEKNAARAERRRDLAAAGEVSMAGLHEKPTALIRSRILEALRDESGDLQGHVVKVTGRGLSMVPLMLCVYFQEKPWCAMHVGTEWEPNCVMANATVIYEMNGMPF